MQTKQYNVVITYGTALNDPYEAIDLAFSVVGDHSGFYYEVVNPDDSKDFIEGEIAHGDIADTDDGPSRSWEIKRGPEDIDEGNGHDHQFDIVLTYNTMADNPKEALNLAVSVFNDRSGGYLEVFTEGLDVSVIEGEVGEFFTEVTPAATAIP